MLSTNGVRIFMQFWYSKTAMFWLPEGLVPGYVEWLLACPKAPSGSISIQVWFMACASVIAIASEGVAAVWALRVVEQEERAKAAPIKAADEKKVHVQ